MTPADTANELATDDAVEMSIGHLEPHNLLALSAYSVLLRFAWIFKTESVIIPAFLDSIAGAGWLRGCLPVLNRFGQSLPPMMFAKRLRQARHKKWSLFGTAIGLGIPLLILSALWLMLEDKQQPWLPAVFLLLYLVFFVSSGLNQLSFGTLQGKLIRPDRRGELLGLSGIFGSVASVVGAWFLLQRWLSLPDHGFGWIFGFSGIGFLLAGACCVAVREPADELSATESRHHGGPRASINLLRRDARFRWLAVVAMLFIAIQLLFPHFQALGQRHVSKERLGYQLMLWVIAQNVAVGVFSFISGKLADRLGNRLSLQWQVFGTALVPLLALLFTSGFGGFETKYFWLTFFFLGLTPVTIKTLTNYALELAEADQHPLYVSTLHACLAVPFVLSPLVGWLVDLLRFERVFLGISGVIALGWLASLRLVEPRHHSPSEKMS
ncbi:MAG TPA: MFS transporter [Planctomycetaceae bacterium]|nr:MFS transporter [Planctomycetaceae bacterium]